jgi:hypothetical protein
MTTLYKRSDEALHSSIGEDVVALNVENGQCYGMHDVTVAVWNILADPVSVEGICQHLTQTYDVRPEVCRRDVDRLISELEKEGLIEAVRA